MTHTQTALEYIRSFAEGEIEKLGSLLAEGLQFTGPYLEVASRADYLDALRGDPPDRCDVAILSTTEEDNEVVVFYELTKSDGSLTLAQWFEFEGGHIARTRLAFSALEAPSARSARPGVVIFTGDKDRLTGFYRAVTRLSVREQDDTVSVLTSEEFELVIHALPDEPPGDPSAVRRDVYVKPFFPVVSLAEARETAPSLGGSLRPAAEEWKARGFTACEGVDPDGNVIQFRQEAP